MSWFYFAIAAGIASNIFNILNRTTLKNKGDSTLYSWAFELLRAAFFAVLFLRSPRFPTDPTTYLWLGALGMNEAASVYFFIKSHRQNNLSVSSFIIKLQLLWTPILAYLIIGERLSFGNYGGIALVLLGILTGIYKNKIQSDPGVRTTLISSLLISLNAVFTKAAVADSTTLFLMFCMSLPAALSFPFLMKKFRTRFMSMSPSFIGNSILGFISNVIAMSLAIHAIRLGPTSKVTAVYQAMMVIAVLYGIFVLKENKNILRKMLGIVITLFGLFFLV